TRPNYSQKYSGVKVAGTKRMSHNWMLRANLTFNNYTESCSGSNATRNQAGQLAISNASNNCAGGQLAPQSAGSGAFGNDFISAKRFSSRMKHLAAAAGASPSSRHDVFGESAASSRSSSSRRQMLGRASARPFFYLRT